MAMGDIAFLLLIFFIILARVTDDSHVRVNKATGEELEIQRTADSGFGMLKWDSVKDKENYKMMCSYCHQTGNRGWRSPEKPVDWQTMIRRMEAAKGTDEYRIAELVLFTTPNSAQQVLQRANQIVEQLRQGASFPAYARQYSCLSDHHQMIVNLIDQTAFLIGNDQNSSVNPYGRRQDETLFG